MREILAGYPGAVGMRILDGRDLGEGDREGRARVAVVSASMARRFWPNQRAIGKRLTLGLISNDMREVVGVVGGRQVSLSRDRQRTHVHSVIRDEG